MKWLKANSTKVTVIGLGALLAVGLFEVVAGRQMAAGALVLFSIIMLIRIGLKHTSKSTEDGKV
jgi:hypothetical protein